MSIQELNEQKATLKREILTYLQGQGLSKEIMIKVCESVKQDAAGFTTSYATLSRFAPRHHEVVTAWIERLSDIESAIESELFAGDEDEISRQQGALEIEAHDHGYASTAKGRQLLKRMGN